MTVAELKRHLENVHEDAIIVKLGEAKCFIEIDRIYEKDADTWDGKKRYIVVIDTKREK